MKALVLLSGGMDSTVLLASVLKTRRKEDVMTLSFDYGSKHNEREYEHALKVCEQYGVKNVLVKLDFMGALFKSDLLKSGGDVPDGHYADESMKKTVVPFRNGIMLSIAAGLAESIEADEIFIANHFGDHAIYPDCRKDFIRPMKEAIEKGTYLGIRLHSPFCDKTKTDIAIAGNLLNVPFEKTWSCYKGGKIHCGTCGTCVERKEAFAESGLKDPTEYLG